MVMQPLRGTAPRLHVDREGDPRRSVSWLELFYDLIYVAAFIQLGEALSANVSWAGVGQFVALFSLLWWAWIGTTFYSNRIDADDLPHRLLVFIQMFAIGYLAIQSDGVFGEHSRSFALTYFLIRVTLVLMYLRAYLRVPPARPLARPFGLVFAVGAAIWLASAFVAPPVRYVLWALAVSVDFSRAAVPGARETLRRIPANREHSAERYAQFTLIVLGEAFIKVIDLLAEDGVTLDAQVFAGLGFAIACALWWTYFDDVAISRVRGERVVSRSGAIWVYGHLPLTMALTAVGVGVRELALGTFAEPVPAGYLWLLVGAVAGALLTIAALDTATEAEVFGLDDRHRRIPRVVAAGLVVGVGVVGPRLPALLTAVLITAITIGQVALEALTAARADRRLRVTVGQRIRERSEGAPCEHLRSMGEPRPRTTGCEECMAQGEQWVRLRLCTACGHVGCCDDSKLTHASRHAAATDHPVIRSLEPDEHWAWCYRDEVSVELGVQDAR